MEEEVAIRRMQQGDINALAVIVRTYQVRALRAAYLITRDRALAEDVVQTAFLRAYERIGQFDPRRPFGPWFLRIVTHDAVKAAVRRERNLPLDHTIDEDEGLAGTVAEVGPGPDVVWEQAETRQEIWAALAQLTPAQRQAVVQRYYLNLSEAEMAGSLGCPAGTIKSRLHAARVQLRLLLRPTISS